MTDYGHDLQFGVFLTPSAQQPDAVLALAELADAEGLDLVTFQDHPYQPSFLETWTLLAAVAARTRNITVAPNVLSVPLRLPPMIGKSAHTLDLLSGGRLLLGLGAGAFWDGIARMGGPQRSGGEAVDALSTAIDEIRVQWPGPIGIGAYRPRMLRLVGAKADAWMPSLGYLKPAGFASGHATIDAAARAAGRTTADVRRMLNLSAAQLPEDTADWPGLLAHWSIEHGFATYVLAADDADLMHRWAAEIAPAVRERVEAHRRDPVEVDASTSASTFVAAEVGEVGEVVAVPSDVADQYARLGVQPTPTDVVSPAWDETARPRRIPTGPGIEYTDTGRAVGAHLIEVHDILRHDLAEVGELVNQVRRGTLDAAQARAELNGMTLRQNNWAMGAMCQRYCTFVASHHGLEDSSIFPHLRRAQDELAPVIDRLQWEHEVIHDALDLVDAALVAHLQDPSDFDPLQAAVDRLGDMLLSHLSYEETELVEPLARLGFFAGQVPAG